MTSERKHLKHTHMRISPPSPPPPDTFIISPFRHPKSTMYLRQAFSPPPLHTAAITGASGGIGLQTALTLLEAQPNLKTLHLLVRNPQRCEITFSNLAAHHPNTHLNFIPLDLRDTRATLRAADAIRNQAPLDLLICNAGIMAPPATSALPPDEIESQFAVNHLSHALFISRLRHIKPHRIIFVSSLAVALQSRRTHAPRLHEKRANVWQPGYDKWKSYADSKMAMSLYAAALANRGYHAVSLHPGIVRTQLVRYLLPPSVSSRFESPFVAGVLSKFGLKSPAEGARLSVMLATADATDLNNGAMYWRDGQLLPDQYFPLLKVREEVDAVYEDVCEYVDSLSHL